MTVVRSRLWMIPNFSHCTFSTLEAVLLLQRVNKAECICLSLTFLCDADGAAAHAHPQSVCSGINEVFGLSCRDHCSTEKTIVVLIIRKDRLYFSNLKMYFSGHTFKRRFVCVLYEVMSDCSYHCLL